MGSIIMLNVFMNIMYLKIFKDWLLRVIKIIVLCNFYFIIRGFKFYCYFYK